MMLRFENPLWWMMLAAAVPVIVHLVARAKPRERRFSSIAFLLELLRRHARKSRPKDWLLLLLRTLACAALAAAFLLPVIGTDQGGRGGKALVIVLDNTASMGAADGQQVRMNQAIAAAESAVRQLGPNDSVNLVTLAGYPRFLFDRPESSRSMLLRELARTRSVEASSQGISEALAAAAEQIRELPEGVSGELLIISDFQAGNWDAVDFASVLPQEVPVTFVNVAQSQQLANTAVTHLSLHPASPLPGQEVTATVHLRRFAAAGDGSADEGLSVTLQAGDLRLTQPCALSEDGTGEVQFKLEAPQKVGEWVLRAETEADAFPADNVRSLVAEVRDKLDCQVIAVDRAQAGFMMRALENTPFLRTLHVPSPTEKHADFVVWNAPRAADVPTIQRLLADGTTVLLAPDLEHETACAPLLLGKEADYRGELRVDGGFRTLKVAAPDDAVFELFRGTPLDALWASEQYARVGRGFLDPLPPGATLLLSYDDGVPALVRVPQGRGCLLIWNMAVTTRDNRMGYSPLFLPMLAETLLQSRVSELRPEPVPGCDLLEWSVPGNREAREVVLSHETGEALETSPSPPRAGQAVMLRSVQPALPGLYSWSVGSEILGYTAVNFPAEESELRVTDLSRLPQEAHSVSESAASSAPLIPQRLELWPWLLALALLCFVAELLLCRMPQRNPKP